eukprot:TRINITY_DN44914_c0_g1_i1.p2 TRINITY_DN44914_c0_g1~~TRINITY_DN44914_c0_g1_i1.p2  ORF type:complete len:136 (+),score=25.42 TRINITY_DN44914_c0_g1_i1:59-409(+)
MLALRRSSSSALLAAFRREKPVHSLVARAFSASGKDKKKKEPPESFEEVTQKLKDQKNYWLEQDHPLHRRILSEWGGLLFFGFFCFLAWAGKAYGEWQMSALDRELAKPRRHRSEE